MKKHTKYFIIACFSFFSFLSQSQIQTANVSFTIKNSLLKSKMVSLKSYNAVLHRFTEGYGYELNGLSIHTVNLPEPVYVFVEIDGKNELLFVATHKDNGKIYNINDEYKISQ